MSINVMKRRAPWEAGAWRSAALLPPFIAAHCRLWPSVVTYRRPQLSIASRGDRRGVTSNEMNECYRQATICVILISRRSVMEQADSGSGACLSIRHADCKNAW